MAMGSTSRGPVSGGGMSSFSARWALSDGGWAHIGWVKRKRPTLDVRVFVCLSAVLKR